MKTKLIAYTSTAIILCTIGLNFFGLANIAQAKYTEKWEITQFNSDIFIHENGEIEITETILADFTNEAHRGILRSIPYRYTNRRAYIDLHNATNDLDEPWDTKAYKENGYLNIEVRHPENKLMSDKEVTFKIHYTIDNVINYFDEHDEFYWNVNGTEWVVPTKSVSATVHLPQNFDESEIKTNCITGDYASKEHNCTSTFKNTIEFASTTPFTAYENMTVVVGMPSGTISKTFSYYFRKVANFLITFIPFSLPLMVLIVMLGLWYKKGRDDKTVADTIMPHYKPPKGLLPSETGTIIDEKMDPQDITATIIDYAIKGYIQINETKKKKLLGTSYDYEFELLKPYECAKPFEKIILASIFSSNKAGEKTKMSELKKTFHTKVAEIKKSVIDQLVKDDYFPASPRKIRGLYAGIGIALIFVTNMVGGFLPEIAVGTFISAFIIIVIGQFMPRKTRKGTETYYQLKGLYEYIHTAEKDRLKFQEDNKIMFEKLLPYAIAFGIATKWTKAFEGLMTTPPTWYHSSDGWSSADPFSMTRFSSRLGRVANKLTENIAYTPSSKGGKGWSGGSGFGGGGFSGGGFGGGGGRGL